jgi:hypothetical protein
MKDQPWVAQVIAVEQGGMQRPFVSLDDLERLDPASLRHFRAQLRKVFDGWQDRTGGVYVHKN